MKEVLVEMCSDPRVVKAIKEILQQRPTVPEHNFGKDNTEEWKARSAERRGFDIWLAYLDINPESDLWKLK